MSDPDVAPDPADVAATFCATLVDEWARGGVTHAVVSPGSRSTPLALAVAADGRLEIEVHHDERSAGFLALGVGLAGGLAMVMTTSGTAAVELHPAIVEAHQGGVALIVCTADRPPELLDVGAPQTVDQTHLFGRSVRWFHQPGVPDWRARGSWRSLAARSIAEAVPPGGGPAGPVHLNLAFREPLVGTARPLPPGRADGRPWLQARTAPAPGSAEAVASQGWEADLVARAAGRGVIVAGAGADPSAVRRLGPALGWPVLADARFPVANAHGVAGRSPDLVVIHSFDAVLRSAFAAAHCPRTVLWLGERPASKVLGEWVAGSGSMEVSVRASGRFVDPSHTVELELGGPPEAWCGALLDAARPQDRDPAWQRAWAGAARAAEAAVDETLARHPEPTEPGVARTLTRIAGCQSAAGAGVDVVVSSSMPIRDVEWFGAFDSDLGVLANRGANGIDGVVSTAVGISVENRRKGDGRRTALLIGDIALLHDSNGLLGLAGRRVDLTVVVVDNDGGGIFSFLPQRSVLPGDRFEQLFGTPHGVDLAALTRLHGLPVDQPKSGGEVGSAIEAALISGGVKVIVVRTDRAANVAVHDELNAAVASRVATNRDGSISG